MELIEPELIFGPAIGFPSPENPKPAAFVAVNKVVVTRHVEGTPEPPFMIDAAACTASGGMHLSKFAVNEVFGARWRLFYAEFFRHGAPIAAPIRLPRLLEDG